MTGPVVRRAAGADAATLTTCFEAAYAPWRARLPDLPDVTGGLEDDIRDHLVWVAEAEGRVAGGLVLVWAGGAAHLANLAVDPAAGGQGLGQALIRAAEAEARRRGAREIRLATHEAMEPTRRLYARLGWVETGREGAKILMAKPL